jgi:hypothetical protein
VQQPTPAPPVSSAKPPVPSKPAATSADPGY